MPVCCYFNPRSLTGATVSFVPSLHGFVGFQSTLPHGSDPLWHAPPRPVIISIHAPSRERPVSRHDKQIRRQFQSTLPHGSDRVKMKYFYNYVNQAFVANKLNLNSKRFHFDVRKYELSHTSLSCEPKLNLWFIYLRNTKILVYSPHHFKSYACSLRLQAILPPPLPLHNHYSFWQ